MKTPFEMIITRLYDKEYFGGGCPVVGSRWWLEMVNGVNATGSPLIHRGSKRDVNSQQ